MKFRTLGRSGYQVSEIGIGCWQLGGDFGPIDDDRSTAVLAAADEAAITFWDTADVYGDGLSEQRIGRYVADRPGARVVATKVGRHPDLYPDGYSKERVRTNLQGSLRRLGVEQLELAQLHCVPTQVLLAGDILGWMAEIQAEGLVAHVGVSVETMEEALFAVEHPAVTSIQTIFNIFRQDQIDELFPLAEHNDVGIIVRLPLASGVLAGKMTKDHRFAESDHRNFNRDGASFSVGETFSGVPFEQAVEFVDELRGLKPAGMSMAQMALRWILDQPAVSTVVTGASRPDQVTENAAVSDLPPLSQAVHAKMADFYSEQVRHTIRGVM